MTAIKDPEVAEMYSLMSDKNEWVAMVRFNSAIPQSVQESAMVAYAASTTIITAVIMAKVAAGRNDIEGVKRALSMVDECLSAKIGG